MTAPNRNYKLKKLQLFIEFPFTWFSNLQLWTQFFFHLNSFSFFLYENMHVSLHNMVGGIIHCSSMKTWHFTYWSYKVSQKPLMVF